jgi:hypothetical protein
MENKPWRIFCGFRPLIPGGDGIRVPIEGVDRRPRVEQRAGVATSAERGVNDHVTRPRLECGEHLVQQNGNVRSGAHLRFSRASASSWRQEACAVSKPGPIL